MRAREVAPWCAALREKVAQFRSDGLADFCQPLDTWDRLLDIADAAADVTAGDPQWWAKHPLGVALSRAAHSQPGSGT